MALRARHAGRRLVEQQHARALSQRDRDLDQPLAAVGQFAHQLSASSASRSVSRRSSASSITARLAPAGRHRLLRRRRARRPRCRRFPARVRPRNSWLIWKVRAMPRFTRSAWPRPVMSSPSSSTRPRIGPQHAGDQIDEAWSCPRRSARSAHGGAALQRKSMSRATCERAEAAVEAAVFQRAAVTAASSCASQPQASLRPGRAGRGAQTAPPAPAPGRCRTARMSG